MSSLPLADRDDRVRAELFRARVIVNRTPHLDRRTRREANRALEILDSQLGLNQIDAVEAAYALELLLRAHSSIAFGLLRNEEVTERFAAALRRLGLRSITDRLEEVPSSVMAHPIRGPIGGRRHRDELPSEERRDAQGRPLPPPPGYY